MTKQPARTRRQFTREFKLEAVRMVTDGGRSPSAVARELGIRPDMLRTWRRQFGAARATTDASGGNGTIVSQDEEVRRLRRELERVTQERDFLKRATVFFAKESR